MWALIGTPGAAKLEDSKGANFIILLAAAACNLQTRTASSLHARKV